jgi:hypothetical protein
VTGLSLGQSVYRHSECAGVCQLTKALGMQQEAARIIETATRLQKKAEQGKDQWYNRGIREEVPMAVAMWCDQCDTPYSSKDPERKQITQTEFDEDGDSVRKTIDICGPCAKGMFQRRAISGTVQDARPTDE